MILITLSALAAIVPMLFYLFLIWKMDKYDREPIPLVLTNYLWGAIGAVILTMFASFILISLTKKFISNEFGITIFGAVIVAPFVEEITKGIFLLKTVNNKKFDNLTDGIVYGGAIGLGFAMTENFLYFINNLDDLSDWINIVIIRTLFSGIMHLVSTASLGAFLGFSKFMFKPFRFFLGLLGLSIAMGIHAIWNLFVSFDSTVFLGFIFMFFSVFLLILIFKYSIAKERKMLFNELYEEYLSGIIPRHHLNLLSSPQRDSKGWIDEAIRIPYIKFATALAFRKRQLKFTKGFARLYLLDEIEYYKKQINNLLIQAKYL